MPDYSIELRASKQWRNRCGVPDHVYARCGAFKVEWSQGDWISAMARTDKTDIKDVNFADEKLEWYYRQ
jgi:hypothetical protein